MSRPTPLRDYLNTWLVATGVGFWLGMVTTGVLTGQF